MSTRIESAFIILLISSCLLSCSAMGSKDHEVIVLDDIIGDSSVSLNGSTDNIDNRKVADVDIITVVDAMFDKINEEPCEGASFSLNAQIDVDNQIAGRNTQLQMVANSSVQYQYTEGGPQLLIKGDGMWVDKSVSSPIVLECYYGKIGERNSFYFNDFMNESDWYYLESDMLENLVENKELLEAQLKDYMYDAKVYDGKFRGQPCYQIVLNTEDYQYIDYIGAFFEQGNVEKYWDAWRGCYYDLAHISVEDVLRTFNLEISVYVTKDDYSFVALTVCSDGIDISLALTNGNGEQFSAPDNISPEPINYLDESKRDVFVKYISKKLFIYGDTPNYYYDEDNAEVRLVDSNYNEIARFLVPEGYKAYGYEGKDNYSWYFLKDTEMTNYEFNSLCKVDINMPRIVISLSREDDDYMGSYPNRKYHKCEWVNYSYGNKEVYILKSTSRSDGTITYIAYVPYHSSKNRGEKVYVECSFIGQEDYPIRSDELKEMVFSILK